MSKKNKLKRIEKKSVLVTENVVNFDVIGVVRRNLRFLMVLYFLVSVVYVNGLWGHFVSDDYATISQNPEAGNVVGAIKQISLPLTINAFIASFFGNQNPVPYHIFSLCLYLVVITLAFIWLRIISDSRAVFYTILVFSFFPIHVEAVSWVSGKPYLLNAFFVLLELIFLSLYERTGNKRYLKLVVLLFPINFLAEKTRFGSAVLIGLAYIFLFGVRIRKNFSFARVALVSLLMVFLFSLIMYPLIKFRIQAVNGGVSGLGDMLYSPFFQYPLSVSKYLQLIFFPVDLTLYHTLFVIPSWLNWSILITYLSAAGYFLFKNKRMFFALVFIFLAAAPSMTPLKVSWLVAERYMFLGSLGAAMLVGIIFEALEKRSARLALGALIVVCGFYGYRIFLRNIDWQTNHKLWVNTVQVSPNSHNAWNNIGDDYDKLNDLESAVKGFTQSTVVKSNYADAYHNRANIFFKMGRYDLARQSYETAISFNPDLYQTYMSLVQIDLIEKNAEQAVKHVVTLVQKTPNSSQSWFVYGVVLSRLGQRDEAIRSFKKSLELDPKNQSALGAMVEISKQVGGS